MLDERLDGQSQGFEQLIKELMETKLMADSGSYRNTSEVGRETVRYTEAIHKQVAKIAPAPEVKKKNVRF